MAELKLVTPLLSSMSVESCISSRGGTDVFLVKSTKTGQTYILKHISVPESARQVEALKYTGAARTNEDVQRYYAQVVEGYRNELEILESLSVSPNIAGFRSYQIEPKQNEVGFDLYLLCEQRQTLESYLKENAMTQLGAANLALDLTASLIDLRAAGFMHRDVKPSNIYLDSQQHFAIGDLGLAKLEGLRFCSMPESMLSSYSAPELFDIIGTLDPTDDLYSVGMILYRIYNGNHAPFEDEKTSASAADKRRISGEKLPAPMYADYEMSEIILKACAFSARERYQSPEELRDALIDYRRRNEASDAWIVPPIEGEPEIVDAKAAEEEVEPVSFTQADELPEQFRQSFSPDQALQNDLIDSLHEEEKAPKEIAFTLTGDDSAPARPAEEAAADVNAPTQETEATPEAEAKPETKAEQESEEEDEFEVFYKKLLAERRAEKAAAAKRKAAKAEAAEKEKSENADKAAAPEAQSAADEPKQAPSEQSRPRRKRKRRVLPALICTLLILGAACAFAYFFLFAPETLTINKIELITRTSDSLTVIVDSPEESGAFGVLCTDIYGNTSRMSYIRGSETVFSNLIPGTQYTVTAEPANDEKLDGDYTLQVSTASQTELLSFTATAISVTQAELDVMILEGPDPGTWTVSYFADGVEPQQTVFSGHTATVANLESDREYTFELLQPEGTELIGETKTTFSTKPTTDIPEDGIRVALSSTSALLSWTVIGAPPEQWVVTITGPGGMNETQSVGAPTISYEDLLSGETYEVTISAPSMLYNYTTKITPTVTKLRTFTAQADAETGSLVFNWECDTELTNDNWKLSYALHGVDSLPPVELEYDISEESAQIPLSSLLPGATYDFTISLGSGDRLDGVSTVSYATAGAEHFSGFGVKGFYLGLYEKPEKEGWTYLQLSTNKTEFTSDQQIAFALQAIQDPESSAESVSYTLIVRDASGRIVDAAEGSLVWDDIWTNNMFADFFPRTPQTAGTYTLQVLFNSRLVAEKEFTVK